MTPNPAFKLCDLVFVVAQCCILENRNCIARNNIIVDSDVAYDDHYRWAERQHLYKRRHRKTLKADPHRSFQPQLGDGELIDLVPILKPLGYTVGSLQAALRNGRHSKPLLLAQHQAEFLYNAIRVTAAKFLNGADLQTIRDAHHDLQSHGKVR
jgi:hypothetical protein